MAGDADMSESEFEEIAKKGGNIPDKIYKCCAKVCKNVVCTNCYGFYHVSCAKRMKNIKFVNGQVICCAGVLSNPAVQGNVETSKLLMKIEYLKQINEKLKKRNNDLKLNNASLLEKANQEKKLLENQTKLTEKVQYLESVIEKKVNTDNINEIDNQRSNQGQIGVRKRNLKESNFASVTVSATRETQNLLSKTTEQTTKPNLEMNNDNNESVLTQEKSNKDYNTSLKANSSLLNEQDWTEVQYNKKKQKASYAN
ncbi:hypothetical protein WA026_011148 [Henosepilachna vigintioctopunctata]|uniref:Uncharacterized protein n=1 Tax=Henosepilachna vigintioctopunctata TaxID=420089 RepID=A0AAW1U5T6_9CUCU